MMYPGDAPEQAREHGDTTSNPLVGETRVWLLKAENSALERALMELKLGIDSHAIVAVTDRRGFIVEANDKFIEISKYSHDELIGAPQSIVNSGTHPKSFFRDMWRTIGRGQVWHGEFCNRAKDGSLYWVATTIVPLLDADGRPERYLSIRTDVTRVRAAERQVRELAFTDRLTGVANRAAVVNHLESVAAVRDTSMRAYLTLSVNELGSINDTFGYQIGDHLLRRTAHTLATQLSDDDATHTPTGPRLRMLGRIGSDSFGLDFSGLAVEPLEAETQLHEVMGALNRQVIQSIRADLKSMIESGLRMGYVLYRGDEGLSGADIFTRADVARRHAFTSRCEFTAQSFEESMVSETQDRVRMLQDLRAGILNGDLRLFLQPLVTSDREVCGYEGLVRWQDPRRGMVKPDDFIPLAEATGLVVDLGAWVLEEGCRLLAEWSKHEHTRDLVLSVNVSERQLRPGEFVDTVLSALNKYGVRPELLRLEVTETMIHTDLDRTVGIMQEIRDHGVQIALDDFGSGYSSLGQLKHLPIHQLKIDRSFVASLLQDPVDAALVKSIIEMAHAMDVCVVAEGVETEEQFAALRELGVDKYQGFLFGKPGFDRSFV